MILEKEIDMLSFEQQVEKEGGVLKRFKNCAFNLQLPTTITEEMLQEILGAARNEFGQENLIIHKLEMVDRLEVTLFRKDIIVAEVTKITQRFGLEAEIIGEVFSVGVGGHNRSYTPVINVQGVFPGWDILGEISNEITNTLPINRVTYEPKL